MLITAMPCEARRQAGTYCLSPWTRGCPGRKTKQVTWADERSVWDLALLPPYLPGVPPPVKDIPPPGTSAGTDGAMHHAASMRNMLLRCHAMPADKSW